VQVVGGLTLNGVSVSTQSVDITALNQFTASQYVSNSYFATTSSVDNLSASVYQTDSTQSNQISANSQSAATSFSASNANIVALSSSIYTTDSNQQNQINSLINATASYAISSSVKVVTDGLQNQINTLSTTASVNALSESIFQTDATQSNNIASNSSSIGLLQTFSGSQYKSDSSSFDSRIDNLEFASGTFVTTASFNSYTQSVSDTIATLATTASVNTLSASIYQTDSTQSNDISSLTSKTGSYATTGSNNFVGNQNITGSLTASGDISSSTITGIGNVTLYSASVDSRINGIVVGTNFVTTASFNTYTSSQDFKNTTFATTGSNTFIGNQIVSGFISASLSSSFKQIVLPTGVAAGLGGLAFGTDTFLDSIGGSKPGIRIFNSGYNTAWLQFGYSSTPVKIGTDGNDFLIDTSTKISGSITASGDISSSGNIYGANLTGSGGTVNTGSLLVTASAAGNTITFTKGDSSTFNVSVSGGNVDTSSLVTTASFNSYTASQDFKNTTFATTSSVTDLSASIYQTDATQSNNIASNSSSIGLLQTFSGSQYKSDSSSFDSRINAITGSGGSIYTGSFAVTSSNTFTGQQTLSDVDLLNQITLGQQSGSLVLFGKGFTSSSLSNITASALASGSNIIFKNNNNTAQTEISSSGNIIHNAAAPTATFKRFIGQAQSATINGGNIALHTLPQISSSNAFPIIMAANYFNSTTAPIFRGPASSSTWNIVGNILNAGLTIGSSTANHAEGIVKGLSLTNLMGVNSLTVVANKAPMTLPVTIGSTLFVGGATTINLNSSSILLTNNTIGGLTINNNASGSPFAVASSSNAINLSANHIGGTLNTITTSGSYDDNDTTAATYLRDASYNKIFGYSNAINLSQTPTGSNSLIATAIIGNSLAVTGSNLNPLALSGTQNGGSAFFGRYNVNTGNRAKSAETIFAVGTGTSTSNRKTGLHIDSGSNTFIEGTLNVSGSTNLTGSLIVTGSSTFSGNMVITGSLTASSTINGITINNGEITASVLKLQGGAAKVFFPTLTFGTSSYTPQVATDGFQFYRNQGQANSFAVNTNCDQYNGISGSQFTMTLQTNGSGQSTFGGANYWALISGSLSQSLDGGTQIKGGDILANSAGGLELVYNYAYAGFAQKVYMDKGLYVSSSAGGTALTLNTNNGTAMIATGSVKITGSLELNGSTITSLGAGAFNSTNTQTGTANVSQSMTFNNNDINNQGISVNSSTQLTVTKGGTYNIQFSAQLLADTGADTIWIWLKKNGTNVSNSATKLELANNEAAVAAWNWVTTAGPNDYYEIVWQTTNGDAVLLAENSTGNIPGIPSVIATVTQIN
jgi:hypothetical protein